MCVDVVVVALLHLVFFFSTSMVSEELSAETRSFLFNVEVTSKYDGAKKKTLNINVHDYFILFLFS